MTYQVLNNAGQVTSCSEEFFKNFKAEEEMNNQFSFVAYSKDNQIQTLLPNKFIVKNGINGAEVNEREIYNVQNGYYDK